MYVHVYMHAEHNVQTHTYIVVHTRWVTSRSYRAHAGLSSVCNQELMSSEA